MAENIKDFIKRIGSHKGVTGILILNGEGDAIQTTLDSEKTREYTEWITQLVDKAHNIVRDQDPADGLLFLRVRTTKHEIMVAPRSDFIFIVIQKPIVEEETPN